jgi:hypothetical protein
MGRTRSEPTLVDLTVTALSPGLIMLMVGSLVFFLVEVLYAGQYTARLLWTLACFVFAAVLLARVAIELGVDRARLLGGALAVVTYLALAAFIQFPEGSTAARFAWAINLLLMGVIWFAADRLTWDCTHIDDKRQVSDMGLLLASGLTTDPPAPAAARADVSADAPADTPANAPATARSAGRKPHTPGLWVVWFAVAALPLFGLLGSLIPASEPHRRRYALLLVGCYLAAALGLLLTTSFLGVRRYLRQRNVRMPRAMTGLWLGAGAGLIAAVVLLALVLPRPYSEYPLLRFAPLGSAERSASSTAPYRQEAGKGDGQPGQPGQPVNPTNRCAGQADRPDGPVCRGGPIRQATGRGQRQGQRRPAGRQSGKLGRQGWPDHRRRFAVRPVFVRVGVRVGEPAGVTAPAPAPAPAPDRAVGPTGGGVASGSLYCQRRGGRRLGPVVADEPSAASPADGPRRAWRCAGGGGDGPGPAGIVHRLCGPFCHRLGRLRAD